ncbi:unnamed protein product [Meloidogyne enterolobii]|uniref:Uncharacterized protein n=1 Tax=Meloidogyne enterolobii TaxID=390850 RepID=A0ACB0XM09_MELEN
MMVYIKFLEKKCRDAKHDGKDWDFDATDIVNIIDPKDVDRIYNYLSTAVKDWNKTSKRRVAKIEMIVNKLAPLIKKLIQDLPNIIGLDNLANIAKKMLDIIESLKDEFGETGETVLVDTVEIVHTAKTKGLLAGAKKLIEKASKIPGNIVETVETVIG